MSGSPILREITRKSRNALILAAVLGIPFSLLAALGGKMLWDYFDGPIPMELGEMRVHAAAERWIPKYVSLSPKGSLGVILSYGANKKRPGPHVVVGVLEDRLFLVKTWRQSLDGPIAGALKQVPTDIIRERDSVLNSSGDGEVIQRFESWMIDETDYDKGMVGGAIIMMFIPCVFLVIAKKHWRGWLDPSDHPRLVSLAKMGSIREQVNEADLDFASDETLERGPFRVGSAWIFWRGEHDFGLWRGTSLIWIKIVRSQMWDAMAMQQGGLLGVGLCRIFEALGRRFQWEWVSPQAVVMRDVSGESIEAACSESTARLIIERLSAQWPHIYVGENPDWERRWKADQKTAASEIAAEMNSRLI